MRPREHSKSQDKEGLGQKWRKEKESKNQDKGAPGREDNAGAQAMGANCETRGCVQGKYKDKAVIRLFFSFVLGENFKLIQIDTAWYKEPI